MTKFRAILIPFILFSFSLFLRLSLISKGPFSVDCLYLALQAEKTLQAHQMQFLLGSGYPLTILFGAFFIILTKLFSVNDPVYAVNLMSVIFGALSVVVLFELVRMLHDKLTALLSSILWITCPSFLGISVYGSSHAPSIFFILLSMLLIVKFREHAKNPYLIAAAIAAGLAGATRLQDLILIIPAISLLFFRKDRKLLSWPLIKKTELINVFSFWILAGIVASLFYLPYFIQDNRGEYLSQLANYKQASMAGQFLPEAFFAGTDFLFSALTTVGVIVLGVGFVVMILKNPALGIFYGAWFVLPLLFYCHIYTLSPRFFILTMPALYIVQAALFARLITIRSTFLLVSLTAFLLLVFLPFADVFPILKFRNQNALLPDFAKWVGEQTPPDARLIVSDDRLFFEYYADRKSLARPTNYVFFDLTDQELLEFKTRLDSALNNNEPIYITYHGLYDYDPGYKFSSFMINNYSYDLIGERLYEDWHQGEITQRTYLCPLLKIKKKTANEKTFVPPHGKFL